MNCSCKFLTMKKKRISFCLFMLMCSTFSIVQAQLISWSDNSLWIQKVADNIYQKESLNGVFAKYEFKSAGQILCSKEFSDGVVNASEVAYYSKQNDGRIFFYELDSTFMGYYCPETKRFLDSKDNVLAVYTGDGKVLDSSGKLYLNILDKSVGEEVVGFFVYFRY